MQVISINKVDMSIHGKTTECLVHSIHVKIRDIENSAKEIIALISSSSWINALDAIDQVAFRAKSEATIKKLVGEIFTRVSSGVTEDFGEYLVSCSAQNALVQSLGHKPLPLPELWKEKITGNPGFDFHTENTNELIVFGEAKYSSQTNPYSDALKQISDFVDLKKDQMDLSDIRRFVKDTSLKNHINNKKAFAAGFSINSPNPMNILKNCLQSEHIDSLLQYPELYIIGVQIDVQ